jgi:hypothetical protein
VKEKRKGPIGRAAGLAEGVAATVRRMQREREPRILVYDETGYARLVQPNGRGYERLQETAERMVALVEQAEADAKPRRARRTEAAEAAKPGGSEDGDAKPRATARTKGVGGTKRAGAEKPRGSRRAESADAKARGSRKASSGSRRSAGQSRRARPGGSADDPKKQPRRVRRTSREGDA